MARETYLDTLPIVETVASLAAETFRTAHVQTTTMFGPNSETEQDDRVLWDIIESLEKDNSKMQRTLQELTEKCDVLHETELNMLKGQLAFKTQNAIIKKVLEGLETPDCHNIIHLADIDDLEMAIQRKPGYDDIFKTEEIRKSAESKWTQLKLKLSWKERHFHYIQNLIDEYYVPLTGEFSLDQSVLEEALDNGTLKFQDEALFRELLQFNKAL